MFGGDIIRLQLIQRLLRLPLQQQGMAIEMPYSSRVETKFQRMVQFRFCGNSVIKPEQYLGLRHARIDPLRIRLDRIHQFDPGGSYITKSTKFLGIGKGLAGIGIALAGSVYSRRNANHAQRQRRRQNQRIAANAQCPGKMPHHHSAGLLQLILFEQII